ncbi:SDR family oxidoreductase [Streptomyces sp. SD31]|uniref:SDR family oxidoreductase n=1 Tax=Streptomyces sp. SD31 TaxID=3452208 RepID=UPI003F8A167E
MSRMCEGRVVIVTGGGRGLGRAHALAFAAAGARVVVNDLGVDLDGTPAAGGPAGEVAADGSAREVAAVDSPGPGVAAEGSARQVVVEGPARQVTVEGPARQVAVGNPARQVVDEIRAAGGEAIAHGGDIATSTGAASLVATALETYGRLDTLVNNAGFLRDRMLVNLDEDDWDAVVRVHLKGHFLPLKHAAAHWRAEAKAGRTPVARVVNTSSGAGLLGSLGQANYSAAKAGIVALTLVAAAELGRYGVQVNAIAPAARTRMTERTFAASMAAPDAGFDAMAPANVSPLAVWLGSAGSEGVTGRVFEAEGGRITVMEGWRAGPSADKGARWTPEGAGETVLKLLGEAEVPGPVYGA